MKRIAAPMVGGLLTSAFLTLEIIPVVYTYWRQEQVLWERLAGIDTARLRVLRGWARAHSAGWAVLTATLVAGFYVKPSLVASATATVLSALLVAIGAIGYLRARPAARRLVWPGSPTATHAPRSAA